MTDEERIDAIYEIFTNYTLRRERSAVLEALNLDEDPIEVLLAPLAATVLLPSRVPNRMLYKAAVRAALVRRGKGKEADELLAGL